MRVFLDTNVLVASFATRGLCSDLLHLVLGEHQLVLGEAVLTELGPVLRGKLGLPNEVVAEAEAFLRREAEVVLETASVGVAVPDPDDATIPGQAVASNADVLVTGDRDLLEIAEAAPVRILDPRGFWELLTEEP